MNIKRQIQQLRIALDQFEKLTDMVESILKTCSKSIHVRRNSTETACLSIILRAGARKIGVVVYIDGVCGVARQIQTKVILFHSHCNGDFDQGRSIPIKKFHQIFQKICTELAVF